ncbi:hypothetical protein [Flavobacterium sp. CF136]|uniref:hypothetical protein n=1 Tax=Flavobacterium sp. (strain CF136) TaxID=1144313 RepID=UPI0002717C1A|nr:hypothetical protein [Flavobacterium sp. CF136]EJL66917.1 hypothetical protein PMI10_00497 [Flavobacterium sp. CF136]
MALIKTKHELELFDFYKKYLNNPHLINAEVIDSYKKDVDQVKKEKRVLKNNLIKHHKLR